MKILFFILLLTLLTTKAFSIGPTYDHYLYVCDLGIKANLNSTNIGVDYIRFKNGAKQEKIIGSYINKMFRGEGRDLLKRDLNKQLSDIEINLASDYKGAQFSIEYCYHWVKKNQSLNFYIANIDITNPDLLELELSKKVSCASINDVGVKNAQDFTANNFSWELGQNQKDLFCKIKFTYKERFVGELRDYNLGDLKILPIINIGVTP